MHVCQVGKMRLCDYGNQCVNELKLQNLISLNPRFLSLIPVNACLFLICDGKSNVGMTAHCFAGKFAIVFT